MSTSHAALMWEMVPAYLRSKLLQDARLPPECDVGSLTRSQLMWIASSAECVMQDLMGALHIVPPLEYAAPAPVSSPSALAYWSRSSQLSRLHPWVERFGLTPQGCGGLRHNDTDLVVPICVDGAVVSVQVIQQNGVCRIWGGTLPRGGHHHIARPRAAITVLCVDLASALAVYQSVGMAQVYVCFAAKNIAPVAAAIKASGSVVVCADRGDLVAQEAAEKIGCGIARPEGIESRGWSSFSREVGEGAGRIAQRHILAAAKYVEAPS